MGIPVPVKNAVPEIGSCIGSQQNVFMDDIDQHGTLCNVIYPFIFKVVLSGQPKRRNGDQDQKKIKIAYPSQKLIRQRSDLQSKQVGQQHDAHCPRRTAQQQDAIHFCAGIQLHAIALDVGNDQIYADPEKQHIREEKPAFYKVKADIQYRQYRNRLQMFFLCHRGDQTVQIRMDGIE